MRMSLARPGACIALKNIVLGAFLRGAAAAGGGAAPASIGLPQEGQNRKLDGTSLPQPGQARVAAAATLAGTIPREAPQAWQAVALSGESASQLSQTRPMVIWDGS